MKRALVTYSSSSSDEHEDKDEKQSKHGKSQATNSEPTLKKRKLLPKLSASLAPVVPIDDPSKHQGRIRTQPFIDGQFAVHVYVPISVAIGTPLRTLLEDIVNDIRLMCPALQVFSLLEKMENATDSQAAISTNTTPTRSSTPGMPEATTTPDLLEPTSTSTVHISYELRKTSLVSELHLSLSRPVFARSHQREDVKRAVKNLAKGATRFDASFAVFAILNNDERTRSFLTVEIGAGHFELSKLSSGLEPLLKEYRQPGYYAEPRYHISIAWILTTGLNISVEETESGRTTETGARAVVKTGTDQGDVLFKSSKAASFPDELAERLEKMYADSLRKLVLPIESICTKIGKQQSRWDLAGI